MNQRSAKSRGVTELPILCAWATADFPGIFQAIEIERKLKGWSRNKKEALIRNDFEVLHLLAQSEELRERRARREELEKSSTASRQKMSGLRSD